jgi:hypothetical protein
MIEGMPARFLMEALIIFVNRDGLAYSFRYMAQATPKGTAKMVVINVNKSVPIIAGSMPPFVMPSVGNSLIKFHDTDDMPFEKISHKITPSTRHTIRVFPNSNNQ